jgi:hypothetical protein
MLDVNAEPFKKGFDNLKKQEDIFELKVQILVSIGRSVKNSLYVKRVRALRMTIVNFQKAKFKTRTLQFDCPFDPFDGVYPELAVALSAAEGVAEGVAEGARDDRELVGHSFSVPRKSGLRRTKTPTYINTRLFA